ncbi:MAG TPA: SCO family protein [Ottowia sp.]|uniref:SCO family protein n=1 Tax=Ottowia sp. TaxID=1898956 RepID=UPI002C01FE94|nr:SCO family protein [Ottowia sp.]HMN20045.1 SCO family protein [Ottowia sp.]
MLRTAALSLLLLLGGWGAASWLTYDFQVWTDEGARRLEVALRPVPAPAVAVEGPDTPALALSALLRQDGGVTIVDFIYTHCQTVCLTLGGSFQQLQAALQADAATGQASGVRLLSISFDAARDDVPALRAYAARLGADPALWRFVRVPAPAQQQALLLRLGVVVVPDGRGDYEHNAALLVFDRDGRLVRVFDLAEQQLALDYARHLARQARTPVVAQGPS